jgi:DNA repair protein RadC
MSETHPAFSTSPPALVPHLVRVELVREGPWPVGDPVSSPAEVFALLQPHAARWDREHFLTVLLDGRHRVVGIDDVAVGASGSCPVHPREVFKAAILANATAIIAAHNHPSGDLTPSAEDRVVTKRLAEAGTLLGIPLLDHLIVTGTSFYSMKDSGII